MRMELHCHSKYSRGKKIPVEGIDSPADLVKTAKALNLGGIALTDHSTNRGWKEAEEACRKHGLLFIPGIEISSLHGHIIGLGLNDYIQSGLSPPETIEKIHEQGGLAIAVHPFDIRREGLGKSSTRADAIEAFNSMNLDGFSNRTASRFARKNGIPEIAGSDSHTKEMLGSCINSLDAQDMDSCLREIQRGRVSFHASYAKLENLIPWARQRMSLSHGDVIDYMERNYWQPKRWVSERLLHSFLNSRRECPWRLLGEVGLAGARGYGLARAVF